MPLRHPRPMSRLCCGLGLSLFLLSGRAENPPLISEASGTDPTRDAKLQCAVPGAADVDSAPELLALADWPLDPVLQDSCPRQAELEAPVELASDDSIRTVLAAAWGTPDEPASAGDNSVRGHLGGMRVALDSGALDQLRGGFESPDAGLRISFGIERAVYINGQLVASTVFNVRDLQAMVGAGSAAAMSNIDGGALLVVQNGAGNTFQVQAPQAWGTIIQNSLNNQAIQSVTTVNAEVNSRQLYRSMSLQSAIQDGLIRSLR